MMRRLPLLALAAVLTAGAADAGPYHAPRTANGAPDLQGVWTNASLTFLERPPIFKGLIATPQEEAMMIAGFKKRAGTLLDAKVDPNLPAPPVVKAAPQADILEMDLRLARIDGQPRSSWIVEPADGHVPYNEAGKAAARAADQSSYDGPETRPLSERCLTAVGSPEGPPMLNTGFNANYQVFQTKDYVAIEVEMNHDVRIIRLGDTLHIPGNIRPWLGDSIGHWEGETLVVETTNLEPRSNVESRGANLVFSPQAKITERFTRTGPDEILYEFGVDDPTYLTRPWRAQMAMRAAKGPIYEYACHEGNYSLANALQGARYEETHPVAAAPPAAPAAAPSPKAGAGRP